MGRHPNGISVVICTFNGDLVLPGCLEAIRKQTWPGKIEVIVVNDDPDKALSLDDHNFSSISVLNNRVNLGPGAARNRGIQHAKFDLIALTDDDCRPEPRWLEKLSEAIVNNESAVAVGGKTLPQSASSALLRYLARNNPMQPLDLNVSLKRSGLSRLGSYFGSLVRFSDSAISETTRAVYSLPSANLAVRRTALRDVGLFDENIKFSGEDQDLCRRINLAYPFGVFYTPEAVVIHEYKNSLKDTLRRSRVYAIGNCVLRLKWPEISLIVFPIPVVWAFASAAFALFSPNLLWLPLALLPLCYPKYLYLAFVSKSYEPLFYFSINFLQDCWSNIGLVQGSLKETNHRHNDLKNGKLAK